MTTTETKPTLAKKITSTVAKCFRCFGGGNDGGGFNPIAAALAEQPPMFAAGVDVETVVACVLSESGHVALVAACEPIIDWAERFNPPEDPTLVIELTRQEYDSLRAALAAEKG